jgi:hypothetical protein
LEVHALSEAKLTKRSRKGHPAFRKSSRDSRRNSSEGSPRYTHAAGGLSAPSQGCGKLNQYSPPSSGFFKLLKPQSQDSPSSQESQAVCTNDVHERNWLAGVILIDQPAGCVAPIGRGRISDEIGGPARQAGVARVLGAASRSRRCYVETMPWHITPWLPRPVAGQVRIFPELRGIAPAPPA